MSKILIVLTTIQLCAIGYLLNTLAVQSDRLAAIEDSITLSNAAPSSHGSINSLQQHANQPELDQTAIFAGVRQIIRDEFASLAPLLVVTNGPQPEQDLYTRELNQNQAMQQIDVMFSKPAITDDDLHNFEQQVALLSKEDRQKILRSFTKRVNSQKRKLPN